MLRQGEIARNCYLVLQGCVREFFYKDGEERTVEFYTEFEPVNSFTSAGGNIPASHNLICMEDCYLTVSDVDLEQKMCKLIPRLERIIRKEVEKLTSETQDKLAKFISSTPEERYLDLLENRPELIHRVPQHQIATYLGIKAESMSRIRKRMMKKA